MNCRANIQITSGRVSPGHCEKCLSISEISAFGRSKTRLARDIGAARASAIYRAKHQLQYFIGGSAISQPAAKFSVRSSAAGHRLAP